MATTFVYIDDDKLSEAKDKVQGFEQSDLCILTNQHKGTWESQLKFIKQNEPDMDGLILDLRLDDYPNESGERADFRGTSLAQEIRTRQKESELKTFPIVLFSGNDKLEKSLESSGKDLFDICIDKGQINAKSYDIYTPQLISLAEGYKELSLSKEISEIIRIDIDIVDERFIFELDDIINNPVHVVARFIIQELIEKKGLLVDEPLLAARLGIDLSNSAGWNRVLQSLVPTKYTGVFSDGWPRWWMPLINNWWSETIDTDTYLRSTPASIRVKLIKEKLGVDDLNASQKIPKADSEEYWTVCKGYDKPLDSVDGLMIEGQENLYPWQDPEYVSIDAALFRRNNKNWNKVARLEEERLQELMQQFKKER